MGRFVLSLCLALILPLAGWSAPDTEPVKPEAPVKPAAPAAAKTIPNTIPGYTRRSIQGFTVLIHSDVFKNDEDPRWQRKPTEVLEHELRTIAQVLPERTLRVLRRLLIWVEWDDQQDPAAGKAIAKYYGVFNKRALWRLAKHKNPLKANNIEIINMRALTREHQPGGKTDRCVILHEMVHAVHFQLFGPQNQLISAAYRQAMERGLYDQAQDVYGRTVRPYARVSAAEYFAELSCAYLNKLHYFPFNRDDLHAHDPVGYRLMELTWGPPRLLGAAIQADAEKVAAQKLLRARNLSQTGKKDEARAALKELLETYPKTKAAIEAKEMLDKLTAASASKTGPLAP